MTRRSPDAEHVQSLPAWPRVTPLAFDGYRISGHCVTLRRLFWLRAVGWITTAAAVGVLAWVWVTPAEPWVRHVVAVVAIALYPVANIPAFWLARTVLIRICPELVVVEIRPLSVRFSNVLVNRGAGDAVTFQAGLHPATDVRRRRSVRAKNFWSQVRRFECVVGSRRIVVADFLDAERARDFVAACHWVLSETSEPVKVQRQPIPLE